MQNKFLILLISLVVAGCITVNVNFPESAVQRAADDFVRDLYREPAAPAPAPAVPSKKEKKSQLNLDEILGIPSAYAQELSMNSEKAREIKKKMAERIPSILAFKTKGNLGESFEGDVVQKDDAKLSAEERKTLKKLIDDENSDRNSLYEEVQTLNSITDRKQKKIRRFFGAAFRNNSPAGTWIEDENGKWYKK